MTISVPSPAQLAQQLRRPPLHLLLWDAPNTDMTLSNVLGRRPSAATRPRYDAVAQWFMADTGEDEAQAVVFTNYSEGTAGNIRPWLEAVRGIGFDVFVKPKFDPEDDIDDDMLEHVTSMSRTHRLVRLVVVSGDGRNFLAPLTTLAASGVVVTVVSFDEVASWARQAEGITFVDLEDIPGAFLERLHRIRLDGLPKQGAWLQASGTLRSHLPSPPATAETDSRVAS